jgi:hypothetical protein
MNHRYNRVNVDPSPYLTTTDEGYRLKGKAMYISSTTNPQCNRLRAMKSTHAARAPHQVRAVGQKPRGFFSPIKRLHHGIWLAEESSKTNHSTTWRTLMMSLLPSIGVGMAGSALTALVLAADWFIWDFRYRISRRRGPELDPPEDGQDVIHVPSASGRELVVNLEPVERPMPPVHRVEAEWLDICG